MIKLGKEEVFLKPIGLVFKNNESDNVKLLEWVDINSDIEGLMPYQKYALSKYLESTDNKFTLYGWDKCMTKRM